MENHEPTNRELLDTINTVLETVNTFAGSVDERFNNVDNRLNGIEGRLDKVEGKLDKVEVRLTKVEAVMVTKDYLDDKLAIRKADLIGIDRKQEEKVNALASKLVDKKVLTRKEADAIVRISPFPVRPVI